MARLVSRAELSRIAGVSDVAVSKACKGPLAPACRDKRIDLDHPVVAAYLQRKGRAAPKAAAAPTPSAPKGARRSVVPPAGRREPPKRVPAAPAAPTEHGLDPVVKDGPSGVEDIDRYANMTLREISQRFGSMSVHRDWLEMRKRQVDIQEKEIKNRELAGKLIPRELVRAHVFGAIEEANNRLLSDAARTITLRLFEMAKSGTAVEAAETTVRELLGAVLHPVKERAARVLRRAAKMASAGAREAAAEDA